jgi:hypothetical protein
VTDSGLVGSTDFYPPGHEPKHHAFSPDGKRVLAKAHLPLDRRKWKIPHARPSERPDVRDVRGDTREQKDALESHLPRVIYHQVYNVYEDNEVEARHRKGLSTRGNPLR